MSNETKNYSTNGGDLWVVKGAIDLQGDGKLMKDGAPFEPGPQGVKGDAGVGVATITYDSETSEFVFTLTDATEQRVVFPPAE